jgi:enamine deaminase RidA (YjgF/YER057c/UK114 family)
MTEAPPRRQWMPLDEVAEPFCSRLLEVFDEVPRTHVQPVQFDLSTAVDIGNERKQLWIAGQIPRFEDTVRHRGVVGLDVSIESARAAARLSLLNLLSILAAACDGDLSRVDKFIRLTGYVRSTSEFGDHARIIDAASEILNAVFGERGRHVRSAIGVMSLPAGASVELECVVQIR